MQIKYLKDAPLGKTGDVADVADDQAKILITLGYAKEYKARIKSDKSDDKAEQTELLTSETDHHLTTDSE